LNLKPGAEGKGPSGALSLRPWGIQTVRIEGLKAGPELT
jgi:hypothetical protein